MSAHEPLSHQHLSDDVLIDALYGLSLANVEEHVRECSACGARWNDLQEKRGAIAGLVNAAPAILAEQRKNVYRRIEHPSFTDRTSRWGAPALAGVAACVLAIGVLVHNPSSTRSAETSTAVSATGPAVSDAQLYTEVYSMEQSFEPSASASLGVLFEQPDGVRNPEAGRVSEQ